MLFEKSAFTPHLYSAQVSAPKKSKVSGGWKIFNQDFLVNLTSAILKKTLGSVFREEILTAG